MYFLTIYLYIIYLFYNLFIYNHLFSMKIHLYLIYEVSLGRSKAFFLIFLILPLQFGQFGFPVSQLLLESRYPHVNIARLGKRIWKYGKKMKKNSKKLKFSQKFIAVLKRKIPKIEIKIEMQHLMYHFAREASTRPIRSNGDAWRSWLSATMAFWSSAFASPSWRTASPRMNFGK